MKKLLILVTLLINISLSAAIIADYRMDECSWNGTAGEVIDQTGTYNAKVDIANTTTTTTQSVINRAGAFNQGNTNSAIALDPVTLNGKTEFTFTAWLYPTSSLASKNTFLSAENATGDNDDLLFRIDGNDINLKWAASGTQNDFPLTTADIPVNQWTFVALSKLGTQACVTINNNAPVCIPISNGNTALNLGGSSASLLLGQDRANGNYYSNSAFPGYMDEVKFFDTNLSKAELTAIYNNENNKINWDGTTPRPEVKCSFSGGEPIVNYRMDECYWFDNVNGLTGDVKDSSTQGLDATSYGAAVIDKSIKIINTSGSFNGTSDYINHDDSPILSFADQLSFSMWVYPTQNANSEVYLIKYNLPDGWGLWYDSNTQEIELFIEINGDHIVRMAIPADWVGKWHLLAGTYDGNEMRLYIDEQTLSTPLSGNIDNSPDLLEIGKWKSGYYFQGNIDEVKIWKSALNNVQVTEIYDRESAGVDYTNNSREPITCQASIAAETWEQVSIPAEMRGKDYKISDIFGDDIPGVYGTDWVVAKHKQRPGNDDTDLLYLDYNGSDPYNGTPETLIFGKGYYLASVNDYNWSVNNLEVADYNSTSTDCVSARCIEIPLFYDTTFDNYSGDVRYTMVSFPSKSPVNWADCRFVINGTAYSPTAAETAGYTINEIWLHDGGSDSYTSCSDNGIGSCKLIPYQGFWVGIKQKVKDDEVADKVKLLVPQE